MGFARRRVAADARGERTVRSQGHAESWTLCGRHLMQPIHSQAFDQHHPPAPELINQCVHCGFCLPACPTYVLWGNEMDSPRGRIYLMKIASDGATGMTEPWVQHMDTCLGCMSCMTAC